MIDIEVASSRIPLQRHTAFLGLGRLAILAGAFSVTPSGNATFATSLQKLKNSKNKPRSSYGE